MAGFFSSSIWHPKKCSFYGIDKDEEILLLLRRDLITNLGWVVLAVLFIFAPFLTASVAMLLNVNLLNTIPAGFYITVNLFWYLFTFGYIFVNFINWFFNVHIVSSKRIIDMDFHGVLYRNISDAPLANIEDVTHTIGGAAPILFNYGDVHIQTAAEQRQFEFERIPEPARIQDFISDLVTEIRHRGKK